MNKIIVAVDGSEHAMIAIEKAKERSRVILEEAKSLLNDFGDKVCTELLEGDADLVIIGSHGVKGLKKYTLGSVVSRIVHKIDKSILIAR